MRRFHSHISHSSDPGITLDLDAIVAVTDVIAAFAKQRQALVGLLTQQALSFKG